MNEKQFALCRINQEIRDSNLLVPHQCETNGRPSPGLGSIDDLPQSAIGNLTLLEKTINSSVSNGSFADKLPGYKQSFFLLTKSLAEKPQVGVNTQLNRAVQSLIPFNKWDSAAIERRQAMLAELARKVWDMPGRVEEETE